MYEICTLLLSCALPSFVKKIPLPSAPRIKFRPEKLKNNRDRMQQNELEVRNSTFFESSSTSLVKIFSEEQMAAKFLKEIRKNSKVIWSLQSEFLDRPDSFDYCANVQAPSRPSVLLLSPRPQCYDNFRFS